MTDIATQPITQSDVFKGEFGVDFEYSIKEVTVNEGSETDYVIGQVLGEVTADGKYKVAVETATDGSEDFAGIYVGPAFDYKEGKQTVAASTDTKVIVAFRGPTKVVKEKLILDSSYDDDTKKGVVYDAIEATNPPIVLVNEI